MGTGTGAGTGRERGRGRRWRPVDKHRKGAGTETGTEARTVAEMGTGTRIAGTGTRIESGRAEERRRSARNRKIVVDAMWETGETWVEKREKRRNERVGPVAANPDNLESNNETGGGAQGTQGPSNNCTSRESVSPLSRLIRCFLG